MGVEPSLVKEASESAANAEFHASTPFPLSRLLEQRLIPSSSVFLLMREHPKESTVHGKFWKGAVDNYWKIIIVVVGVSVTSLYGQLGPVGLVIVWLLLIIVGLMAYSIDLRSKPEAGSLQVPGQVQKGQYDGRILHTVVSLRGDKLVDHVSKEFRKGDVIEFTAYTETGSNSNFSIFLMTSSDYKRHRMLSKNASSGFRLDGSVGTLISKIDTRFFNEKMSVPINDRYYMVFRLETPAELRKDGANLHSDIIFFIDKYP
jgi:hypothetical protein